MIEILVSVVLALVSYTAGYLRAGAVARYQEPDRWRVVTATPREVAATYATHQLNINAALLVQVRRGEETIQIGRVAAAAAADFDEALQRLEEIAEDRAATLNSRLPA